MKITVKVSKISLSLLFSLFELALDEINWKEKQIRRRQVVIQVTGKSNRAEWACSCSGLVRWDDKANWYLNKDFDVRESQDANTVDICGENQQAKASISAEKQSEG